MSSREEVFSLLEEIGITPEGYAVSLLRVINGLTSLTPDDVSAIGSVFIGQSLAFVLVNSVKDEESYKKAVAAFIELFQHSLYTR